MGGNGFKFGFLMVLVEGVLLIQDVDYYGLKVDRFDIRVDGETVLIEDNGFKVVIDPVESVDANIILLTSSDHLREHKDLIESMCSNSTCLIVPADFEGEVNCPDVERTQSPDSLDIFSVEIDPVTYRNINGYRFVMGDHSFFVQGPEIYSSEAKDIGKVDTAFLYVEPDNISEIVRTGVFLKPNKIIPYGFDDLKDVEADLRSLKADFEDRNLPFDNYLLE